MSPQTATIPISAHTWAARYNTWLLFKLTLKGMVLFCSQVPKIAPCADAGLRALYDLGSQECAMV